MFDEKQKKYEYQSNGGLTRFNIYLHIIFYMIRKFKFLKKNHHSVYKIYKIV